MTYTLVDDNLTKQLEECKDDWLVLDKHPDFNGYWYVNSFDDGVTYNLNDHFGPYRAVGPEDLDDFLAIASEHGYKTAFFDDPTSMLEPYERKMDPPPFEIESTFENTINGMLPFQVEGFNILKDLDAGVLRWDTGTGKTIGAAGLIKYHQQKDDFDLCWFVVRKNNRVNTVRKLKKLAGVDAYYISGSKARREKYYKEISERLARGDTGIVVVTNYEKFKDDFVYFEKRERKDGTFATVVGGFTEIGESFVGHRLLCIWDEMPTKLKTRTTRLYQAICSYLYDTVAPKVNWEKRRSEHLRQYMLSATPIENSPEDWFNCIRLLTGSRVYGTVVTFYDEFVRSWNYYDKTRPDTYHQLDKMRLMTEHMVHHVDKSQPEIAAVFPEVVEDNLLIDWDDQDRKLYDKVQEIAKELYGTEDQVQILSLIHVCQMICDMPTMVLNSAARREAYELALDEWEEGGKEPRRDGSEAALKLLDRLEDFKITDKRHTKLDTLRALLTEIHPESKAIVFCTWNKGIMPSLESWLEEWGITYVRFNGTDKQRQEAIDRFQEDPEIRVFLSSDTGSDSIDLDAASVVINYNLPWKWTTKIQRQNRQHRPTSQFDVVYVYTLLMEDSVDERREKILEEKHEYHDVMFLPGSESRSGNTMEDYTYILYGE